MTYEEILQYISGMNASPVDLSTALQSNPNAVNGDSGPGGFGQNIAWGNVPGLERFYSYDGPNNQENFNLREALPVMQQMGYQVMQGFDPGAETSASWVAGPDGRPIAQSARLTGMNDDKFKLAALAAMGITGANVLGAGFGAGGAAGGGSGSLSTMAELGAGAYNPADFAIMEAANVPSFADVGIKTLGGMAAQNIGSAPLQTMGPVSTPPLTPTPTVPSTGFQVSPGSAGFQVSPGSGGLLDLLIPAAGAIGGFKPSDGETITSQSKTDPRIDPYIYGDGGILKELQGWYQANKGPNENQQAGWQKSLGLLNDPALSNELGTMRSNAFGMLGNPVAGNPFTSGQASLQAQPWQAMPRRGLFGG